MFLQKFINNSRIILSKRIQFRYIHKNTSANEEINKFNSSLDTWWDLNGPMKGLHSLNKLRVPLIRDGLINNDNNIRSKPKILEGFKILDIGCGGGILTEPLARLGADVTGLDPNSNLISKAKEHALLDKTIADRITYIANTIENISQENINKYDAVIISEVIEHIVNKEDFLKNCISTLKNNGSFFVTTINKTSISWLLTILMAEYIFKIIPLGTHDWEKFISPNELKFLLEKNGCSIKLIHGCFYNVYTNEWTWIKNTQNFYVFHAIKL